MHIYHALINALSAHMIHINLNMIVYTHFKPYSSYFNGNEPLIKIRPSFKGHCSSLLGLCFIVIMDSSGTGV